MPGRHHLYRCRHCGYEARKSRAVWHVIKDHREPQDAPFSCSRCPFRSQMYGDAHKHVTGVHTDAEVHANPQPYSPKFHHESPDDWDLKWVEPEPKSVPAEATCDVIPSMSAPILPTYSLPSVVSPDIWNVPTVRETITSVKTQVVTANVTLGQVKSKASDVMAATTRIEGKVNAIDRRIQNQDVPIVQEAAVTIKDAATRTMEAADKFSSAVDSFKAGMFPLIQALIDGQKSVAIQLQQQQEAFMKFMRTSAATPNVTSAPSSHTGSAFKEPPTAPVTKHMYGQREFDQAWESAREASSHGIKRPSEDPDLFTSAPKRRDPVPARSAPLQHRVFNNRRYQIREMPKVVPISAEELARRKAARERRHEEKEQEERAKAKSSPAQRGSKCKPRRAIMIDPMQEDKENRKQPRLTKQTPDVPKEDNAETGEPQKKTVERDTDTDQQEQGPTQGTEQNTVALACTLFGNGLDSDGDSGSSDSDSDEDEAPTNSSNWKRL